MRETDLISDGRGRRRGVSGDTPVSGGLLSECEHQLQKENTESVTGVGWAGCWRSTKFYLRHVELEM